MKLENGSKIALFKKIKGTTNESVTAWAEFAKPYLKDQPLLILDNAKGHYNDDFLALMDEYGVTVRYLPPGSGKLLNPCDNSLHASFKSNFFKKKKKPHELKIKSINEAYFEISEESIINCFKQCGYLDSMDAKTVVSNLISSGYRATEARKELTYQMQHAYRKWKLHLRSDAHNIKSDNLAEDNTTSM